MSKQRYNTVYVLGNGFDLSLGLKTRYSDFANNKDYWPITITKKEPGIETLASFLERARNKDPWWFDIENLLKDYVERGGHRCHASTDKIEIEKDKQTYIDVCQALSKYIREQCRYNEKMFKQPDDNQVRFVRFVEAMLNDSSSLIYDFNYTDLEGLAARLGIPKINCFHVHGEAKDDAIVLGINSHTKLLEQSYDFLFKPNSPNFNSPTDIVYDLLSANMVVFYGHSLTEMDYGYFKDFFEQASRFSPDKEKCKIRIVTRDNSQKIELSRTLNQLDGIHLEDLYKYSDFKFIFTDDNATHQREFNELTKEIENNSPIYFAGIE